MAYQQKNTLLESGLSEASPYTSLREELKHMFVNLRNKGYHETDRPSLYAEAASACYRDSFLVTGTFSENKGVLG